MNTPWHYRFADPAAIPDLARLVAHSFPGAHRTPEWWTEQLRAPLYGGGADTTFVAESTAGAVGVLQLHGLRQWVGGEALAVAGVGSVAISPTHRRRGIAAQLVTQALRAARYRGDVGAALYPFRTSFYRGLGFGQAGDVLQYQVAPAALEDSGERARVELVEDAAGRDAVLELYNRWAATQTGQLVRESRLWTHLCTAPGRTLVTCGDGYALVTGRTDLPPERRYLEVDELVWTTQAARRALYGWLASLGDQWQQLLLRALPSQRLGDWLSEPRLPRGSAPGWALWEPAATLMAGPMFRLVDVQAAWALRTVVPTSPALLKLELADAQIEDNAGAWTLVIEDGHVLFERTATQSRGSVPMLRTDVSTLSRIYIGAITAMAACQAGLADCDRPELLAPIDDALALPEPWTFDRF